MIAIIIYSPDPVSLQQSTAN